MVTAELIFPILQKVADEVMADAVNALVVALQRNGQVLSDEWPIAKTTGRVRTFVSVPERSALRAARYNRWVNEARLALRQAGLGVPRAVILGDEPNTSVCTHKSPGSYVLYTDAFAMESPLRCGDCFQSVPFYRIPHTSGWDTYEDIIFWRRNYQRFDGIWLASNAGEKFAYQVLTRADSQLSTTGRELCEHIRRLTGKNTYYYLYRHYGRSHAAERRRTCPGCSRRWLLSEPWHSLFDFRCERCGLVSNIANDCG